MADDETVIVVCMRVDQPGIYVVPGSVMAPCTRCTEQVWVAGSTFKILFGTPREFVCTRCVRDDETGHLGEALLQGPHPEQTTEMAEYRDEIQEYLK